jgi:rhamnosyl/mannosyltransferase
MKVLHIGKFFFPSLGGIETFLMDLTQAAHAKGVEQGVLVHAQNRQQGAGRGSPIPFPHLSYFERVHTVGSFGYAPISPGFPAALNRALRDFAPDLLHLHMPNPSAFWALLSPHARGLPWILHWHADAADSDFAPIVRALYPAYFPFEQALLKRAAAVIVSSPPYLDASRALGRWKSKCHAVPLGMNPERLTERAKEFAAKIWQNDKALRVLALGRLATYKGFDKLVQAAARTKARIVIAGDGEDRARLEAMVSDLKLRDRVHLLGGISDSERNSLLDSCDLVCLPSINRAEAFGISVLEGMAVGKPALVSRLAGSGLPWLVVDNETGWQVTPGDVENLSRQINHLDENRATIENAGIKARHRFEKNFHISKVAAQITALQETFVQTT